MAVIGRVHSFQSMGAVDGPGLRCVVFMQGCPLRCVYCHNPDTHDFNAGEEYSAEEMVKKILRFEPYIKNGGVTVSGGEPLSQPEFVEELFRLLKTHGIHTAIDTAGIGDLDKAERVLKYTDLVLADIKFLNNEQYSTLCGADFSRVQAFMELTKKVEKPTWIREVIVPDINDTKEDVEALVAFAKRFSNVEKIELLAFRKLCEPKYESLGIEFKLKNTKELSAEKLAVLQGYIPKELLRANSSYK